MSHESLRPYALGDWWAFDESTMTRLQQARRSLALVHDLVEDRPRTAVPTVEVNQEYLGALLALVVENLETVEIDAIGMRRYVAEHAEAVRWEMNEPAPSPHRKSPDHASHHREEAICHS